MAGPNPGADLLFGTQFNDYLFGFAGNDVLTGLAGNDLLNGGNNGDILNGGRDNDTLNGAKGNDILVGTSTKGVGEQDILTGGAGRDKFVLGTAAQVLYDDGNTTTAGRNDYALIADFSTSTDGIQLKGQRSDYVLAASPGGLPGGTAVYRNKPGSQPDELIGIIRDRTGLSLNSSYFSFVGVSSFNLSTLNGRNGFVLKGIDERDRSGSSVSTAGDVNGDGFDDLLIGAFFANSNGQSYVVFGKAGGFDPSLNLSALNGSNGFVLQGIDDQDQSGFSVSTAGDVNGDGFDDLLIGAVLADPNGQTYAGESYVVFGKAGDFDPSFNLSTLNGRNGFVLKGIDERDFSGDSVSTAGDVNGDGFDDLLIGARGADSNGQFAAGESYVVFGKAGGFNPSLNLSDLNGRNGFVLKGIDVGDSSGASVSTAGDVNGDGFDDLLIGAYGADPNGQFVAGESYVVFGKAGGFNPSLNLSALNGSNGFVLNGINRYGGSGRSVSTAGDVNGDGFDDLLIGGAPNEIFNSQTPDPGESYVVFGRDFTGQVTRLGTAGRDSLTGTASDDILIGGLGNDTLRGGRGTDVLLGGGGDDILAYGPVDRRLNGGSGTDTLRIDVSGINLDLSTPESNRLMEFETIDLTGRGNNSLSLRRLDVLDLSDTTNRLIVNGNTGDRVTSVEQGWMFGGTTTLEDTLYNRYTVGAARLLVDTAISQTIT